MLSLCSHATHLGLCSSMPRNSFCLPNHIHAVCSATVHLILWIGWYALQQWLLAAVPATSHRCCLPAAVPGSPQVSKDGAQFAAFCADSRVRVWRFATGKLRRTYDESLEVRTLLLSLARCWCLLVLENMFKLPHYQAQPDALHANISDLVAGDSCTLHSHRAACAAANHVVTNRAAAISYAAAAAAAAAAAGLYACRLRMSCRSRARSSLRWMTWTLAAGAMQLAADLGL
jgi:hypothetical protein